MSIDSIKGKESWDLFSFGVIILAIGYALGQSTCKNYYNPRNAKNGIDTIYTKDSMYPVHISIDTAMEIEREYEPPEDPR